MTNYSRSVLKSNGPHCSKNLPVKFGFSSKTIPANIVQKLPSQRCSKPFLIPPFNFSHKRLTFALIPESGYILGLRRKIAHNGLRGEAGAFRMGVLSLSARTARSQTSPGRVSERQTLPLLGLGQVYSRSRRRDPAGLRDLFLLLSKLQLARPALRAFCVCEVGVVSLPSVCSACCQSVSCAGVKTANLPISEVG